MRGLTRPEVVVAHNHKGFPPSAVGEPAARTYGRLTVQNRDFVTPVLTIDRDVLADNIAALQSFCDRTGLSLSPHVKTTMSPEIIEAQLAAGSWAVSVATVTQAMTLRALGASRILVANEMLSPVGLRWLVGEMTADPDFTGYLFVDSEASAYILESVLGECGASVRVPVLIELGVMGGRAGVRDIDGVAALAQRVARSQQLLLAGISGFEGAVSGGVDVELLVDVRAYMERLRSAAETVIAKATFDDTPILSIGGSVFPELVAETFDAPWQGRTSCRVVLRSGCYVTHDTCGYELYRELVRANVTDAIELRPALELWGTVLSRPEPHLAILDFGKRDVGIDAGYPVPLHRVRWAGSVREPAPTGEVFSLNDQHAYMRVPIEDADSYQVGDLVGFGIAHPCTTFDKWRLIPVVDAETTIVSSAQTLF